eukprot:TRINITY_DN30013_c0_g1_i1.p1 TRINITY_DN30013_c0_g1~~TRINITY_DN30013_c0_g1_i1.p1  ORF type:complete len:183 (+),score=16.53 TRINITY_DN30013_c0_g1_i1:399-947(+)
MILEELEHFKESGMPHSRPNSMNKHGVILHELGLDSVVNLIKTNIELLAEDLFPELVGDSGLDSNKSFTVEYDATEDHFDKDLATHFDNAEVTLNISLTDDHEEGELYFIKDDKVLPVKHRKGHGILHSGRDLRRCHRPSFQSWETKRTLNLVTFLTVRVSPVLRSVYRSVNGKPLKETSDP